MPGHSQQNITSASDVELAVLHPLGCRLFAVCGHSLGLVGTPRTESCPPENLWHSVGFLLPENRSIGAESRH